MIPKNELRTLIMSLDFFDDMFSIGEELPQWIAKKKEDLEVEEYPIIYEEDKKSLQLFLEKCLQELKEEQK